VFAEPIEVVLADLRRIGQRRMAPGRRATGRICAKQINHPGEALQKSESSLARECAILGYG
jgi:hypothetical protein